VAADRRPVFDFVFSLEPPSPLRGPLFSVGYWPTILGGGERCLAAEVVGCVGTRGAGIDTGSTSNVERGVVFRVMIEGALPVSDKGSCGGGG